MPSDSGPDNRRADGRRTLLRALTGGGALAALTVTGARDAAAAPPTHTAAVDPFSADQFRPSGRVREFWIQADSFTHNVAPNAYDGMMGSHLTAAQTTYEAIGYRAYTPNWGRVLDADHGPHGIGGNSGIPGPVLRAEVGDVIKVHFRNNDSHYKWPHSMHPHGVRYDRANDGAWMADAPDTPGSAIPYGGTYTYTWRCTPGSVGSWPYHDHSAPQRIAKPAAAAKTRAGGPPAGAGGGGGGGGDVMEIGAQLGLFGMLAITDEQTPVVDREFVLFFHHVSAADVPSLKHDLALCNGGSFVDNAPTFTARTGDRVRWRVATLGDAFHVFHVHGHRWYSGGSWVDSQVLGPATTLTVEYTEDNPGSWLYHCHVTGHMMHGMAGRYVVTR